MMMDKTRLPECDKCRIIARSISEMKKYETITINGNIHRVLCPKCASEFRKLAYTHNINIGREISLKNFLKNIESLQQKGKLKKDIMIKRYISLDRDIVYIKEVE